MKRRQLIIGIGGTAGLGSAIGTGAFTSVSAERDVTVETADDANALLAMEPLDTPNGNEFATTEDGLVELDFSTTNAGGSGLGVDSVYDFDDVFQVTNQGTQPVYLWATFADSAGSFEVGTPDTDIWLYTDGDSGNKLRDSADDVRYLTVGASADIGVHVDTDDLDEDQELTITITAAAEKPTDEAGVVGSGPTRIEGPTDGLVSYWSLDDVESGTAVDAVGTNSGTINGDVSAASGERPGANFPPGSGDYVDVGDGSDFAFENFTVSAWARAADGDRGLRTIVARQDETASNPYEKRTFILWFDDNDSNFGAEVITGRTSESDGDLRDVTASDEDYVDDEWHHIAMTVAADDRISLYVDGDHKGTNPIDGSPYTGSAETWVGLEPGQARPLAGDVGDLRIYDRVLSSGEIGDLASNTE